MEKVDFGARVCGYGRQIPLYPTMSLDRDRVVQSRGSVQFWLKRDQTLPLRLLTHCKDTLRQHTAGFSGPQVGCYKASGEIKIVFATVTSFFAALNEIKTFN